MPNSLCHEVPVCGFALAHLGFEWYSWLLLQWCLEIRLITETLNTKDFDPLNSHEAICSCGYCLEP